MIELSDEDRNVIADLCSTHRLVKRKWPIELALKTPVGRADAIRALKAK